MTPLRSVSASPSDSLAFPPPLSLVRSRNEPAQRIGLQTTLVEPWQVAFVRKKNKGPLIGVFEMCVILGWFLVLFLIFTDREGVFYIVVCAVLIPASFMMAAGWESQTPARPDDDPTGAQLAPAKKPR